MKERVLREISDRNFMVRLLGNDASNEGCLIQIQTVPSLDSARENTALTGVLAR
jgi:hypothetical protein